MSGIVASLLQVNVTGQRKPNQIDNPLSLRGKVKSVEIVPTSSSSAFISIKVSMELINTGAKPIILLGRDPRFVGAALAKDPGEFAKGNTLVWDYVGPARDDSPEWATLRASLDKPSPPTNETRIIMPNESWILEASVGVDVPTDPSKYTSSRKKESLEVIRQLSPVWLLVTCEMWPNNIEGLARDRDQLPFGHKLQKRWKDAGLLWLDDMRSEPIQLDLKTAVYKPASGKSIKS